MMALNRFRRDDISNLRVGDLVRYNVLYQSRTGFVVRLRGRGRIETLNRHVDAAGSELAFVEGLLRDDHGIVTQFKLTGKQRVYRKTRAIDARQNRGALESPVRQGPETRDA
jgi:hypothetical protein